jgi:hypothetical protein
MSGTLSTCDPEYGHKAECFSVQADRTRVVFISSPNLLRNTMLLSCP